MAKRISLDITVTADCIAEQLVEELRDAGRLRYENETDEDDMYAREMEMMQELGALLDRYVNPNL